VTTAGRIAAAAQADPSYSPSGANVHPHRMRGYISYSPGTQQQTGRALLQRTNGTDRRADSVPLHRRCFA